MAGTTKCGNNRVIPSLFVNTALKTAVNKLVNFGPIFSTTLNVVAIFYNTAGYAITTLVLDVRFFKVSNINCFVVTMALSHLSAFGVKLCARGGAT